jgi:hypothetical protein
VAAAAQESGLAQESFVQVFKYIEWIWRKGKRARAESPTVIHAHSLSALPVGVAAKWMTGAPLLYDAHELEMDSSEKHNVRSAFYFMIGQ